MKLKASKDIWKQSFMGVLQKMYPLTLNPIPVRGGGVKIAPPQRFFVSNPPTFHFLEFSFTHFLAISQNFRAWGVCRVWLKFLADVSFFAFQFSSI